MLQPLQALQLLQARAFLLVICRIILIMPLYLEPSAEFESKSYTVGEGDGALDVCLVVGNFTEGSTVSITVTEHTATSQLT